jgi:GcrA cell cycle regulator
MRKFEKQAPFDWTDKRVEFVKSRWTAGDSAGTIADALGVSRNSVIGKVRRLGLPYRTTTTRSNNSGGIARPTRVYERNVAPKIAKSPVPRTGQLAAQKPPARLLPPVAPDLPILSERGEASQGIPFAELTEKSCKFPLNSPPPGGAFIFCGKDRKAGSPYCVDCHAIAYSGVSTRRPALPMRRAA